MARWPVVKLMLLLLALMTAVGLVAAGAGLDGYIRQGAVWGAETATLRPTSHPLGANTFLHLEADRAKVDRTTRLLREAGITVARQQFPWNEIEPQPGQFIDQRTGRSSWEKYDYLVESLSRQGVRILARPENTPVWARPGQNTDAAPFGPPNDFDLYAEYVGRLVSRYRGKLAAIQIWNEPNLANEWGQRRPDPVAYTELLRRAYRAAKAADPGIVVIAAGLAPTDGLSPEGENDLIFLEQMYAAGARDAFDAMGVMIYGLGQSPDNRWTGLRFPINLSRPVLTRAVMLRHDDGAKPIWALEYGYIAVPPDWSGRPSTWGASLSEAQQAAYLSRGLERMRAEWPWLGGICLWAFRFVEGAMDPQDPQRFFGIVRDDFSLRPAYRALADRPNRGIATPGVYTADDPIWQAEGPWELSVLAGRTTRLAGGPPARLRLIFDGDRLALLARRGPGGGRLYVTLDGGPVPGLPTIAGRSYLSLRGDRTIDAELPVIAGLLPGHHQLEVSAGEDGEVALHGVLVARDRPFAWAFVWFPVLALLLVVAIVRTLLSWLLTLLGYQPIVRPHGRWGGYIGG